MARKIAAVINVQTRQPIIQSKGGGLNSQNKPIAKVPAIRNPHARGNS